MVDVERGELDEHALLGRRAQAAADGARRRAARPASLVRRQGAPGDGRRRLRSRALHLRLRGRNAARLDADRSAWLVDPVRGRRRRGSRRGRVPRASRSTARASTRPTSTTRASTSTTRTGTACARAGAFVDRIDSVLVRAVRHPGDRRARVRHLRLPRAGERKRRADRRLRRRVRPRRASSSRESGTAVC